MEKFERRTYLTLAILFILGCLFSLILTALDRHESRIKKLEHPVLRGRGEGGAR